MSDQITKTPPTEQELQAARDKYQARLGDEIGTAELEATLAKFRRDTAVWNKEALEARFQVHQATSQIRKLALDLNLVKQEELDAADNLSKAAIKEPTAKMEAHPPYEVKDVLL